MPHMNQENTDSAWPNAAHHNLQNRQNSDSTRKANNQVLEQTINGILGSPVIR
ncbi:hypothetical protein OAG76_03215 [Rubripirellula sp.]|nr:hypothetical protein [Rubripirellula sp.]MDB4634395.1 hypothetical protein [Rubripirellula sp.]